MRLQEEGHPYWDIRNPPGMVDRYSHVVNARMHAMRRNLDAWGRLTHTLTLTLTLTVILTLTLTLSLSLSLTLTLTRTLTLTLTRRRALRSSWATCSGG